MALSVRELLVGSEYNRLTGTRNLLVAVVLAVATFVAYAVGVFAVSGGVLVIPGDATLVGLAVAVVVGYQRGGVAFAWIQLFAAYLGFQADWALFGLSGRTLVGKLAFFFDPVGLAVFATAAVVFGTLAYSAGLLTRRAVGLVRHSARWKDR